MRANWWDINTAPRWSMAPLIQHYRLTGTLFCALTLIFANLSSCWADVRLSTDLLPHFARTMPANNPALAIRNPAISRGVLLPSLFIHPNAGGNPTHIETVIAMPVATVNERIILRFQTGISDGIPVNVQPPPDGVIFRCRVDGQVKWSRYQQKARWEPAAIDLTEFSGRQVKLEFQTDPVGSDAYDWALVGAPFLEVVQPSEKLTRTGLCWFYLEQPVTVQLQGAAGMPLDEPFFAYQGINAVLFRQGGVGPVYLATFDSLGQPSKDMPRTIRVASYAPALTISSLVASTVIPTVGKRTQIRVRITNKGMGDSLPVTLAIKSSSATKLPQVVSVKPIQAGQTGGVDLSWVPSAKDVRKPIRFVATLGTETIDYQVKVFPLSKPKQMTVVTAGNTRIQLTPEGVGFVEAYSKLGWRPAGVLYPLGAAVRCVAMPKINTIRIFKRTQQGRFPVFYVGDTSQTGAAGASKVEALLPGLEYLSGAEVSGSTRGFTASLSDRSNPTYMQQTLPMATVAFGPHNVGPDSSNPPIGTSDSILGGGACPFSDRDYSVSLAWRTVRSARVLFQSPAKNGASYHILSAQPKAVGDWVDVVTTQGRPAHAAVEWYRNHSRIVKPTRLPLDLAAQHALARAGLATLFDKVTRLYKATVEGPPEIFPGLEALSTWDAIWNKSEPAAVQPARTGAEQQTVRGPSHIMRWELPFITGDLAKALPLLDREIAGIRARQDLDGGFRAHFKDSPQKGLGLNNDEVSGTLSHSAWMLLRHARITGDGASLTAGIAALKKLRNYQLPRGASIWEVPMYEPDMLAAAWIIGACNEAYRATHDSQWLVFGQYWANTALPFIFLTGDKNRPARLGSCIPTFGTTFFLHSWIGRPVPWQGLVLAWHLRDLADELVSAKQLRSNPRDLQASELHHIAGLLVGAAKATWVQHGVNIGTYPDSLENLRDANPVFINPENLWMHIFRDEGHPLIIQTVRQRGQSVSSVATIRLFNTDEAKVIAKFSFAEGRDFSVLFAGVKRRPKAVSIDETDIANDLWSYDASKERLIVRITPLDQRKTRQVDVTF